MLYLDSTHVPNFYDFNLTTILVLGEGVPVAWMISNREDTLVLIEFFKKVKARVSDVKPKWIMSDMAEQFYTAWIATFGHNSSKKLICAWHLDRA